MTNSKGPAKPPSGTAKKTPGKRPEQSPTQKKTSSRGEHVTVRKSGNRTTSSQRWLERQLNDPYVRKAQQAGWRSRAAFKLLELDEKFHLLRPGATIVDLGAAPGGWTQVAVSRQARRIVAVDLLEMDPIPGAIIMQADFSTDGFDGTLKAELGGSADLVLSDMAPNTIGHAATDHLRIMALAEMAVDFAVAVLAENGSFVAKVFQGGSEREMLMRLKQNFRRVVHAKPPASRKGSSELYVVAMGFKAGFKSEGPRSETPGSPPPP